MEQLQDLFGHLNFKKPGELTTEADLETTVSVIESIVSIFDENGNIQVFSWNTYIRF